MSNNVTDVQFVGCSDAIMKHLWKETQPDHAHYQPKTVLESHGRV